MTNIQRYHTAKNWYLAGKAHSQIVTAAFPRYLVRCSNGQAARDVHGVMIESDDVSFMKAVAFNYGGQIIDRWNWK